MFQQLGLPTAGGEPRPSLGQPPPCAREQGHEPREKHRSTRTSAKTRRQNDITKTASGCVIRRAEPKYKGNEMMTGHALPARPHPIAGVALLASAPQRRAFRHPLNDFLDSLIGRGHPASAALQGGCTEEYWQGAGPNRRSRPPAWSPPPPPGAGSAGPPQTKREGRSHQDCKKHLGRRREGTAEGLASSAGGTN